MDWKRRCEFIPDGCSTMSKQPCRYVEGVYPQEIGWAQGAYIGRLDLDTKWIDYTLGLGTVILGHNYERVRRAVAQQLAHGTIYGLPCPQEAELAQKLVSIIPGAEMVRFTNTGSEADHAAVKIARAVTGRERVACCGYHGWFSWYSAQSAHSLGCTADERQQIQSFIYNDLASLEKLFASGPKLAAVIMEPYVFDTPKPGFLEGVRDLCTKSGTVLIFDEVVTGFRTPGWTASAHYGITPDLTCLGKCMSNGVVPISVVCGKRDLMMVLTKGCFVSGTFAANPLACTVALETISVIEDVGAIAHIWSYGDRLKAHFDQIVNAQGLAGVAMDGQSCRSRFHFPTPEHLSLFWQECLKQGVFFGYAQFISYSHQQVEFDKTVIAMGRALDAVARNWNDPLKALQGKPAQATFRMTVGKPVTEPAPATDVPAAKYRCSKCSNGFDEPYLAEAGRYRNRPACPRCHTVEIQETVHAS
jgi:glutamate-1-semialdehyde 2,1-aminomutase